MIPSISIYNPINILQENIFNPLVNSQLNDKATKTVKSFINKLSLSLIKADNNDSSKVISSISLSTLAGMIILSMDDNTDKEKMLGLATGELTPELEQQIHIQLSRYTKEHPFSENSSIASANFLASIYHIQDQDFNTKLFNIYDTEKCELTGNKSIADAANEFIAAKTKGKITNLFNPNYYLSFVMGNVLVFKGIWENKFEQNFTQPREFQCTNGQVIANAQMMSIVERTYFASNCGFNIIIKNFKTDNSNKMQFVAIIPEDNSGQTIENLNTDIIDNLIAQARNSHPQKMRITIPVVEIDSTIDTLKQDIETALGVTINAEKLAKLGLQPSDQLSITQKVKASINEEGADCSVVSAMTATRSFYEPPEFTFNKPGYITIIDGNQKLIEITLKDETFLVTDGPIKYGKSIAETEQTALQDSLSYKNYLSPDNIYRTTKEIESCMKKEPTIAEVLNLRPYYGVLSAPVVIEEYTIDTTTKPVKQYLVRSLNTDCRFNKNNQFILNGSNIIPFTPDDCVTLIYSSFGKLEFKCKDIPVVSLVDTFQMPIDDTPMYTTSMDTTIDITMQMNNKFNANGDFTIKKAVIDDYRILISVGSIEECTKLENAIRNLLVDSKYYNFIQYIHSKKMVEVSFSAADKLKQLLKIDNATTG